MFKKTTVCVIVVMTFLTGPLAAQNNYDPVDNEIEQRALLEQMVNELKAIERLSKKAEAIKTNSSPHFNFPELNKRIAGIKRNLNLYLQLKEKEAPVRVLGNSGEDG